MKAARQAAELAARQTYGRLLAYLTARTQDVAAAEDALGDAFLAALQTWPEKGIPPNPDGWLLLTAKRKLIDKARRHQAYEKALQLTGLAGLDEMMPAHSEAMAFGQSCETIAFPDERLKLLFVCAHPAIAPQIHTPLMLQTVLGLNAEQIASAFLISPATMGQRLVRAKAKIRDARIPFELPTAEDLPTRLAAVLEAIYAAYNHGWEGISGSDARQQGFAEEAIWLARLCVDLTPKSAEAKGVLALMLFCESRRRARRHSGAYVPLSEQDPALWSQPMILEAEQWLTQASELKQMGRFQIEAAIQSAHAQRIFGAATNWEAIALLYEGLIQLSPTLGALVSRGAAIAQAHTPQSGLEALQSIPPEVVKTYQPYWALKAHLLRELDQKPEAQSAYERAIGLSEDVATRAFLQQRLTSLGAD
jgi:predicted RNA polymerase sigma factor